MTGHNGVDEADGNLEVIIVSQFESNRVYNSRINKTAYIEGMANVADLMGILDLMGKLGPYGHN